MFEFEHNETVYAMRWNPEKPEELLDFFEGIKKFPEFRREDRCLYLIPEDQYPVRIGPGDWIVFAPNAWRAFSAYSADSFRKRYSPVPEHIRDEVLKRAATVQLVNELMRREGVTHMFIEPHENVPFSQDGPARILIVTD